MLIIYIQYIYIYFYPYTQTTNNPTQYMTSKTPRKLIEFIKNQKQKKTLKRFGKKLYTCTRFRSPPGPFLLS